MALRYKRKLIDSYLSTYSGFNFQKQNEKMHNFDIHYTKWKIFTLRNEINSMGNYLHFRKVKYTNARKAYFAVIPRC